MNTLPVSEVSFDLDLLASPLADAEGDSSSYWGPTHNEKDITDKRFYNLHTFKKREHVVCVHLSVTHTCRYIHTTSRSYTLFVF